jgi:hypothetical protein
MEPCLLFALLDPTRLSALFHCMVGLSKVCHELSQDRFNILLFLIIIMLPLLLLLRLLSLLELLLERIVIIFIVLLHLHHHHPGRGGGLLVGGGGLIVAGGLVRGTKGGRFVGGGLHGVGKGTGPGASVKLSTRSSSCDGAFVVDDDGGRVSAVGILVGTAPLL